MKLIGKQMYRSGHTVKLIMVTLLEPVQIYSFAQAAQLMRMEKPVRLIGHNANRFANQLLPLRNAEKWWLKPDKKINVLEWAFSMHR